MLKWWQKPKPRRYYRSIWIDFGFDAIDGFRTVKSAIAFAKKKTQKVWQGGRWVEFDIPFAAVIVEEYDPEDDKAPSRKTTVYRRGRDRSR